MQFDRPRRLGHASGKLPARSDIVIGQDISSLNLAALAHANLNTGVIDKAVFATGDVFLDEPFVFPHLTTAFDLGLGEIFGQQED